MTSTTLISVSSSWRSGLPEGMQVSIRASTWGLNLFQHRVRLFRDMVQLAVRGRRYDRVVVVTCGWEVLLLCLLKSNFELFVVDWLAPGSRLFRYLPLLRRVDQFIVIRSADIGTLVDRFGVDPRRCRFTYFPAPVIAKSTATTMTHVIDDPTGANYVYSAGWAHRDWATLSRALEICRVPAVVSCSEPVDFSDNVRRVDQLSPEIGGQYLSQARSLVLAFHETYLPCGPLVLLDGMARGKPIITTRVGGTKDYVTDGRDGLLVDPADPQKLADAIRMVYDDAVLRERLGEAAQASAAQFTAQRFWADVLS